MTGTGKLRALLRGLVADRDAHLILRADDVYEMQGANGPGRSHRMPMEAVRRLQAQGLLQDAGGGRIVASPAAAAWLARQGAGEEAFQRQHAEMETRHIEGDARAVCANAAESPVGTLARRRSRDGEPWLAPVAVAAAERIRRDFEVGQLQPRITANWTASVSGGRRDGGGLADISDMAMAARRRFDGAVTELGPELAGIVVDVCCFLKGLETVEREHRWPARSAKLVLRIGLAALARHYGLCATASGGQRAGIRHWGAQGFKPGAN